ncbi:MAG: multidrug efflux pump subunit AcrB, partial [Saprospiraceae bacterium]
MRKEKFIYNTSTLRYEKVEILLKERILKAVGFLCAIVVSGFLFTLLVWKLFPSPEEKVLLSEIQAQSQQIQYYKETTALTSSA